MKKIFFLSFLISFSIALSAQRVYFVYLQSESGLPFYVKMGDKIYSSTTSGYLILSKLKDSTYVFNIGQAGSRGNDPKFSLTINRSDKGFLIKNMPEGVALFDLQSLSLYKSIAEVKSTEPVQTKNDSFTKLLAQASDDTTLLTQPILAKQEVQKPKEEKKEPPIEKTEDAIAVVSNPVPISEKKEEPKKDTTQVNTTIEQKEKITQPLSSTVIAVDSTVKTIIEPEKQIEVKAEVPYVRSTIVKRSESSTTEGFGLVFLDQQNSNTDTVRILIPNPRVAIQEETPASNASITETKKTLDIIPATDSIKIETKQDVVSKKEKPFCGNLANENDFKKLRKNMAAENSDDEMIAAAKKYFKAKCFNTEQLRNLSLLFLTASGKYQFFDAAYNHVIDQQAFPSLQSELKDEYYIKRFKALIGE